MGILKKIITILVSIMLTLSIMTIVKADSQIGVTEQIAKYNLQREIDETTLEFEQITQDIINQNISLGNLSSNRYNIIFDSTINSKLKDTETLDDIYFSEIKEIESYYIIPENTSSGDLVIVVDTRVVNDKNNEFLVLFEYHINSGGRVYGMNTWVY